MYGLNPRKQRTQKKRKHHGKWGENETNVNGMTKTEKDKDNSLKFKGVRR